MGRVVSVRASQVDVQIVRGREIRDHQSPTLCRPVKFSATISFPSMSSWTGLGRRRRVVPDVPRELRFVGWVRKLQMIVIDNPENSCLSA